VQAARILGVCGGDRGCVQGHKKKALRFEKKKKKSRKGGGGGRARASPSKITGRLTKRNEVIRESQQTRVAPGLQAVGFGGAVRGRVNGFKK